MTFEGEEPVGEELVAASEGPGAHGAQSSLPGNPSAVARATSGLPGPDGGRGIV